MICPKCGQESSGNYCSRCGSLLYYDHGEPMDDLEYLPRAEECEDRVKRQPKEGRGNSRARRSKSKASGRNTKKQGESKRVRQKRENRIKKLEHEVEHLRNTRASRQREYETEPKGEQDRTSFTDTMGHVVSKGGETLIVTVSRLLQLVSFILMAAMVWVMAFSYWQHGQNLGELRFMVQEQNFGLALYVGVAGLTLLMGLFWCLWILTKKGAGGGVRLKRYDTGRGFLPFLLCILAVLAAAFLLPRFPQQEQLWRGMVKGAKAALSAVYDRRSELFFFSGLGAALSLVRKILSV